VKYAATDTIIFEAEQDCFMLGRSAKLPMSAPWLNTDPSFRFRGLGHAHAGNHDCAGAEQMSGGDRTC
jgi:hypothetical protein